MNANRSTFFHFERAAAVSLSCAAAWVSHANAQESRVAEGSDAAIRWELPPGEPKAAADPIVASRLLMADANIRFEPPEPKADAPQSEHAMAHEDGGKKAALPEAEDSGDAALAKKLNNPIASLISVPFQLNFDKGYGPKDAGRITLNIQPVIPFSLSEDWNLILRTIVPVIWQDALADGLDSEWGIGDTLQSFFFSPKEEVGGWIIGAGPVVSWPTGTNPDLRSEALGLGPTIVALRQHDGWTYGMLANQVWSVTESEHSKTINSTFLQPFVAYTWPTATTLTLNTESSYDWTDEEWTVPINLMVSQVLRLGKLPISLQLGGRYYAEAPEDGPEWGMRFTFTLLFPN